MRLQTYGNYFCQRLFFLSNKYYFKFFRLALIRSISGLRGTLPDSLTPQVVIQYAGAFAKYCNYGTIVVGYDGRPSGEWICKILEGALIAAGAQVVFIGLAPTPTVQLATEKSDAAGGISVTASHNPAQWNGLKFLSNEGIFLDNEECINFWNLVDSTSFSVQENNDFKKTLDEKHFITKHIFQALSLGFVDIEAVEKKKYKIVVDAVNSSGSEIIPKLLETCGCEVIRLFCDSSGIFPHTPEPIPENLTQLAESVIQHNADLGIAIDPDADRLVIIDETGNPIGEEYTITLATDFILAFYSYLGKKNLSTVINLSTTRAVEDVANKFGAKVFRTPVGEINVAKKMKEVGAVIGGEGSGGVILSEIHYGRDSIVGVLILIHALAKSGKTMSQLRADLPEYYISKKKINFSQGTDLKNLLQKIVNSLQNEQTEINFEINFEDGLRIAYSNSWVHLRGSNTEPIIRVIAEAPTPEAAENLACSFLTKIETSLAI